MDWFRWHHGTVTDPKWRVIARRASVTVRDALAVWAAMLECASQSTERGVLTGWDHEDIGAALDMDAAQVEAIYAAMQGKVLDGDKVSAWEKRQPLREDSTAAERKRLQRDRERQEREQAERDASSRDVTQGHAPDTDTDTEEIREEREVGRADAPTSGYVWEGRVIKLKRADYDRWKHAYPAIPDFAAALQAADDWYAENPKPNGKWFHAASGWLKNENQRALKGSYPSGSDDSW